ncbi:MAG: hypothetical protein AB2L20_10985 [Mangrovibacterium sp.]
MERRDFISTTALGTSLIAAHRLFSSFDFESLGEKKDDLINPIIPIEIFPGFEDNAISDIIALRNQYGFRRFLIIGPSKEYRYTGFPGEQVFIDLGEQILRIKKKLQRCDIEIGWWCTTTIRIGKGKFQSIIRGDGSIALEACCPLDPDYRETFSRYVAAVVQIAKPFMVNFEDDYHLSNGCYCPFHLNEFAGRKNHDYTREELQRIFQADTFESKQLQKEWNELKRDSLAMLAASVREKVDQTEPDTRLCLCQSGANDRDGDFTEAVTKAFAGKTRPAVRVYGTSYFSDDPLTIPQAMFNPLYQKQHLPSNFEIIHESDTFPHTRFFMSSSKLRSLLTAAFAYGLDESLLYVNQYLENPLEEDGYCEMFKEEVNRFNALKLSVKNCKLEGCEIFRVPGTSYNWVQVMGRLGIPYTSGEGNVKLVSGDIIKNMNQEDTIKLLKGKVFLDGYAALQVCNKGLSKMIGAEISSFEKTLIPPFFEGVRDLQIMKNINNRLMYNYVWAFNSGAKDTYYKIEPFDGTEIITDFLNTKNQPLSPGLVRSENEFGGRIAVMAFNLNDNYICTRSISMFNYTKKELIRQVIEWAGKDSLPVFVKHTPNVYCIFSRSETNTYAIIVVINLGSDTFDSFSLDIAPEWINSRFELLNHDGKWRPVRTETYGKTVKIDTALSLMDPVVLKFIK